MIGDLNRDEYCKLSCFLWKKSYPKHSSAFLSKIFTNSIRLSFDAKKLSTTFEPINFSMNSLIVSVGSWLSDRVISWSSFSSIPSTNRPKVDFYSSKDANTKCTDSCAPSHVRKFHTLLSDTCDINRLFYVWTFTS